MNCDKSVIEKIESMASPDVKVLEKNGGMYANKELIVIKEPDTPAPGLINLNTLSGLVEYIKQGLDKEVRHTIHVENYNSVDVYGEFNPTYGSRKYYCCSEVKDFSFMFNTFLQHENFIISLMSQFIINKDMEDVLGVIGKLTTESNTEVDDDGIGQKTTIRKGVSAKTEAKIPNPVKLTPRRTFPEIEQPSSQFVLRMRGGEGRGIELALFEASGGGWRVDCIQKIGEYFKDKFKDDNSVIIIA